MDVELRWKTLKLISFVSIFIFIFTRLFYTSNLTFHPSSRPVIFPSLRNRLLFGRNVERLGRGRIQYPVL